ncbi:unnamed protein product [Colias eurytheme]|nr:unnamed protein product [Colias eurytheme]
MNLTLQPTTTTVTATRKQWAARATPAYSGQQTFTTLSSVSGVAAPRPLSTERERACERDGALGGDRSLRLGAGEQGWRLHERINGRYSL